jgi:hypothetical protein
MQAKVTLDRENALQAEEAAKLVYNQQAEAKAKEYREADIVLKHEADAKTQKEAHDLLLRNAEADLRQKKDLAKRNNLLESEAISLAPSKLSPHVTFTTKDQEKQNLLQNLRNGTVLKDPMLEKRKKVPGISKTEADLLSKENLGIRVTSNDKSSRIVLSTNKIILITAILF